MALGLALARIVAGGSWLLNLAWKLPPDYGRNDARGLHYWLVVAREHAVGSPLRAFVRDVVSCRTTRSSGRSSSASRPSPASCS